MNSFVTIRRRNTTYIHVSPENQGAVSKCNNAETGRGGRNLGRMHVNAGYITEYRRKRRVHFASVIEDVGRETMQRTWNNVFYSRMHLLSLERKPGRKMGKLLKKPVFARFFPV